MIFVITKKITSEQLRKVSEDLKGYIKFVVDAEREILAAGGLRHFEAEQKLLADGSKQENLWGGGWDLETNELDFDSIVNIRPDQNQSREVLNQKLRGKIVEIVDRLLRKK